MGNRAPGKPMLLGTPLEAHLPHSAAMSWPIAGADSTLQCTQSAVLAASYLLQSSGIHILRHCLLATQCIYADLSGWPILHVLIIC